MATPDEDILELGGRRVHAPESRDTSRASSAQQSRERQSKFLAIWFRCCHVYGRLYRNSEQTAYEGRCPRCGANVQAKIGPKGTARRMFEAM